MQFSIILHNIFSHGVTKSTSCRDFTSCQLLVALSIFSLFEHELSWNSLNRVQNNVSDEWIFKKKRLLSDVDLFNGGLAKKRASHDLVSVHRGLKAWLSHYGSCQKASDFATSHDTHA